MGSSRSVVYGPVPSRRLGRSLGIDLIPYKTCTYDCIYCQLGRTTNKTICREEYVPLQKVCADVELSLRTARAPDYIALAGSGEPTLYAKIGELIAWLKTRTKIPVAVITNGSLLWDTAVAEAVSLADVVIPSLDAVDETTFAAVNHPHESISFAKMLNGYRAFRQRFRGRLWLEVFLLGGMTAIDAEVRKIAALAEQFSPDKIQLNTAVRPTAEQWAVAVQAEVMERFAKIIGCKAEVIAYHDVPFIHDNAPCDAIIELLERRPCSLDDISRGLGITPHDAAKHINTMLHDNIVALTHIAGKNMYSMIRV